MRHALVEGHSILCPTQELSHYLFELIRKSELPDTKLEPQTKRSCIPNHISAPFNLTKSMEEKLAIIQVK